MVAWKTVRCGQTLQVCITVRIFPLNASHIFAVAITCVFQITTKPCHPAKLRKHLHRNILRGRNNYDNLFAQGVRIHKNVFM